MKSTHRLEIFSLKFYVRFRRNKNGSHITQIEVLFLIFLFHLGFLSENIERSFTLLNISCDFHGKNVVLKDSLWELKIELLAKFGKFKIRCYSVTVSNKNFLFLLVLVCELTLETL
jgi:hypothetical protein